MLIPLFGNAVGFGIMAFWFGVSLYLSHEINESIGHGYFLAVTSAATDLLIRATATRSRIRKLDLPKTVGGARNADSIWLVSSQGPTLYVPVWILGLMIAVGSFALDRM